MGLWTEWRAQRERSRRASAYLGQLLRSPEHTDIAWLASLGVSEAVALRELTFAKRAIGLVVAERDALDDRTASDVAHQLAPVISREARATVGLGREWGERWRAYTAALAVRGNVESPATRLARVLLGGAGIHDPSTEQLVRATQFVNETRGAANVVLRDVFGVASLPEDIRPSALRG
ncbi:hypothetical protein [Gemmatimonas groenlandica]|uniref:Uncharacterized protein n=1 Tax=Gemmatimonas groenlandica TaxID=2732249 RepID=A0A6M4IRE4_9BACT|nr:hypothetical protein [Gemmatimonas groenlandica]QJR34811.1 hypothetical protein HKW67_04410 [Gemmatimonas groenlandica]